MWLLQLHQPASLECQKKRQHAHQLIIKHLCFGRCNHLIESYYKSILILIGSDRTSGTSANISLFTFQAVERWVNSSSISQNYSNPVKLLPGPGLIKDKTNSRLLTGCIKIQNQFIYILFFYFRKNKKASCDFVQSKDFQKLKSNDFVFKNVTKNS